MYARKLHEKIQLSKPRIYMIFPKFFETILEAKHLNWKLKYSILARILIQISYDVRSKKNGSDFFFSIYLENFARILEVPSLTSTQI